MKSGFSLQAPFFSTPSSSRCLMLIIIVGWALLGSLIFRSLDSLVHDEPMHLEMAQLLVQTGDFKAVLDAKSDSATGPMYALVHAAFSPLTQFEPLAVRFLNLGFSFIGVYLSYRCVRAWLKLRGHQRELLLATHAFFLSTTAFWVITGVALTESQTLICVAGAMLLHPTFQSGTSGRHQGLRVMVSGLVLGLAICNRPLVLPVLPVALLVMHIEGSRWTSKLLFVLSSALLPALLFTYWGGFTRPSTQVFLEGATRWEYGAFSFAYVLFMGLIWCPTRFLPIHWKTAVALLLCGGVAWLSQAYYPTSVTWLAVLNLQDHAEIIGYFMGGTLFGLGIYTALRLIYLSLSVQGDFWQRSILFMTFLLACVPIANKLMFTTRYFMALLPFALLLYLPHVKLGYGLCARIAIAIVLSYVGLQGYFRMI